MKHTKQLVARFVGDESGQNMVEYALVIVLVALAAVAAMGSLGKTVSTAFSNIGSTLNSTI